MKNINIHRKYRKLLARLPVNLENAKGKNDKNTSLLYPVFGHILRNRTNKIVASARKAADTEFKKGFNVTLKQTQTGRLKKTNLQREKTNIKINQN